MATPTSQKYKCVDGDTLEKIAKKNKLRDWQSIWKAPENRDIVSKRKKPELIQPGDLLFIPLNDEQLKKLAEFNKGRDNAAKVRASLEAEVERINKKIKVYDTLVTDSRQTTIKIVEELKKNLTDMKKWGNGVDAAAFLATMGVTLGKLAGMGSKAATASGEVLAKLNKEAAQEAVALATAPVKDGTVKITSTLKDRANKGLAALGVAADAWEKMNSPSFWANTYVQMTQNGKTWSQAVSSEIGEDIEERMKSVIAEGAQQIKKLQDRKKELASQLTETQNFMKECDTQIKFYETEAAKLGQR